MPSDPPNGSKAELIASWAALISAVTRPLIILIVIFIVVRESGGAVETIKGFLERGQSVKGSIGFTGASLEITAGNVTRGVAGAVRATQSSALTAEQAANVDAAAKSAATDLLSQGALVPGRRLKVLWVDDRPWNNIGLQYAFQNLGIVVICVDNNNGVQDAFATANGYDVVITDMWRDGIKGKTDAQPEAGMETVSLVRAEHPGTPVIIYAGSYSLEHANDPLRAPIISITSDPQIVFSLVVGLAKKKLGQDT